jgi:hypothetical protein
MSVIANLGVAPELTVVSSDLDRSKTSSVVAEMT